MKLKLTGLVFLTCLLSFSFSPIQAKQGRSQNAAPPPPEASNAELIRVEQAIEEAISAESKAVLAYQLLGTQIDNLAISQDEEWSTAWLNPVDPETGRVIPAEPGLAIARREMGAWQVTLPSNPEWEQSLQQIPADLLPVEEKAHWQDMYAQNEQLADTGPFGGYLLPFARGTRLVLTRSILHYNPPDPKRDMHYAFDFAAWHDSTGKSPMFPVYASKAGSVKFARWSQENGSENSPGNYLVLEDTTTTPTTYQLYLHLARETLPEMLRVPGAYVLQGQYIGMADDTGASSGNHLHFQVHTNPASYWGKSVDITFEDVPVNAGRPRTMYEAKNFPQYGSQGQTEYISGNSIAGGDYTPPVGDITEPVQGVTLNDSILHLQAWARDELSGLRSAQIIARYGGAWHPIGDPSNTGELSLDWDLCAGGVPDGPVSLALQIQDMANNQAPGLPGLRHLIKSFACSPPPVCTPGESQVALFTDTDFRGQCQVLGIGSYTSPTAFALVGNDNVESIRVGEQVQATLYLNNNLKGRGETYISSDTNLDGNLIGTNTLSSLLVQSRTTLPAVPLLLWPADGETFPANASLSLSWDNGGGALEYQVEWNGNLLPWQSEPSYPLGSLSESTNTWRVRARNSKGEGSWSAKRTLKIQADQPGTGEIPGKTVPFSDNFENDENGWQASSHWIRTPDNNQTLEGTYSWMYSTGGPDGYDTGAPNSGYLTSPPVLIPGEGVYYLRFWFFYETESPGSHWDKRWVQIGVDGGPFTNLLQLSGDPSGFWLQNVEIPLAAYAGHTIQVRFYFETLDAAFNNYGGWWIDDFSITGTPPVECSDAGNSPEQAVVISYGSTVDGVICPGNDIDYYTFSGTAGDQIGIAIDAQAIGSTLDSLVSLLDVDRDSVLAWGDDQILTTRTDSLLSYRLLRDGVYFIKVKAWDYPSSGSSSNTYRLRFYQDGIDPSIAFIYPPTNSFVPTGQFELTVSAGDNESGISHVQFYWHSGDWQGSDWQLLGEDWDGEDGWSYLFTNDSGPQLSNAAFYAVAYDWGGNSVGALTWGMSAPAAVIYMPLLMK